MREQVPASDNQANQCQECCSACGQLAGLSQQGLAAQQCRHMTSGQQLSDAVVGYRVSCTAKLHFQAELFHMSGHSSERGAFVHLQSLDCATADGQSQLPCMVLCSWTE